MAQITKEEYDAAVLIVKGYEAQLLRAVEYNKRRIHEELLKYFKLKDVSSYTIKDFNLSVRTPYMGTGKIPSVEIIFNDPMFDEDFFDNAAERDFELIGKKYGVSLRVESGIHGK